MKLPSPRVTAILRVVKRSADIYLKKQVARSAAALSFFITMSLFPFLICLNWLVGILHVDFAAVVSFLGGILPQGTAEILDDYIQYIGSSQSTPMLVAGLVLMVTTSSAAFRTIRNSMADIYSRDPRNKVLGFLVSFAGSFVFLLSVYVCILLVATGNWFLNLLNTQLGIGRGIQHWSWIRFLVLFLFVLLMLYGLYRFSAPRQKPRVTVIGGALLTAVSLVAVSIFYSFFISFSTRYSLVYGSLASVIVLMMWLYTCSNILFMGGIFNVVLDQRKKARRHIAVPPQSSPRQPVAAGK